MKKNKLFIFISIITAILISGLAATCNFCGTPITVGEEETEEQKTAQQASSQTHQTAQQVQGEPAAPTIELNISEGPSYSEADDVCFWRIEATVTGNPAPKITWSKDDSGGTLGDNIAQVNLTRDDPRYTLVGTAKNSVDTATDDIVLTWGCDGEEGDGGESGDESEDNNCPVINDMAFVFAGYDGTLPCGSRFYFVCKAEDADGDELTYDADISDGTVSARPDEEGGLIDFTAPDTPGTITLTVTVSDGICEAKWTERIVIVCE